jgi:ketosteroid isomerase-like protein
MSVRNKEIVGRVNDSFAKGDTKGFLTYCTDDVVWKMVGDKTVKGKQAILDWMGSMPGDPPKFTVDRVAADGDTVMASGDMTMPEKDGQVGHYSYCDVYRFQGDKIAELKAFVIKTDGAK